jgi:Cu-Zn family superoxide dismutase
MKSIVSISAAMLLATSLAACGNNDEPDQQDQAAAGETSQNNTASGNDNAMDSGSADTQDSMASDASSDGSAMSGNDTSSASSEDMPKAGVAVLHGTAGNDGASATIRFTPKDGGLAYTTQAQGLEPGKHGYHIHVYGDCSSDDGKSAGTHFNLKGSSKNPPEDIDRITGDLGELDAGDDGSASGKGMLDGASLTGAKALIGRAVIIHAKPNDPNEPPIGAAGSRQACGVIGIAEANTGDSGSM